MSCIFKSQNVDDIVNIEYQESGDFHLERSSENFWTLSMRKNTSEKMTAKRVRILDCKLYPIFKGIEYETKRSNRADYSR